MVIFKGDKRVFDKTILEVSTSTSNNRIIEITGLKSLDELINVPLYIKTTQVGIPICTLEVRNESESLGSINIKTYSNGILTNPKDNWIYSGQTYLLVYNGTNALVNNASEHNNSCSVSADILNLTSTSTKSEITEAFRASESNTNPILDFIQAVTYSRPISLYNDSSDTATKTLNIVEQETEVVDTITYYTISVLIPSINTIRSLKFKQTNSSTYLFDSVEVTNTVLTSDNTNAYSTEEQVIGTWIDDKPLYRKVITLTSGFVKGEKRYAHNIANVKEIERVSGMLYRNDGWNQPLPTTNIMEDNWLVSIYDISSTEFSLRLGQDQVEGEKSIIKIQIIFEYTKTTD